MELNTELRDRLTERLERARTRTATAARPRRSAGLTPAQRRLWFLDQLQPGSAAYNIPAAWRISGPVDAGALQRALRELVRRHDALRTCVRTVAGEPEPVLLPEAAVTLREVDGTDRLVEDESRRPFALDREPPLRATLGRDEDGATLVLVAHHIAVDGWSMGIIARELSALYGRVLLPEPLYIAPPERRGSLGYWRERLAGAPPVLEIPGAHARPSGRGAIHRFTAPDVRLFAQAERVTPFAVQLAAFAAACARWSGEPDVVIGVPASGRDGAEALVGNFVNTVPVRVCVDPELSGRELIARVRDGLLADLDHELPFEELVEALSSDRDPGVSPLVQVLCVGGELPRAELALAGAAVAALPVDPGAAKLDLSLAVDGALTYNADRFDATAAARLADQYATLLAGVIADPDARVVTLPLGPAVAFPAMPAKPGTVLERFLDVVARTPDAPAVSDATLTLTYAGLHARAAGYAAQVRPGERIALPAERSVDTIAGMLGIMLAGAAYVPIEPGQPQPRIDALVRAAGARFLPPAGSAPAELPPVDPASLAYVIFTSGSTGEPKGVAVEHRHLRAYVDSITARMRGASFAVASTLAADLGHTSVFGALCTGARLQLIDAETATDPVAFAAALRRQPVDVLKIVPSHLAALLSGPDPRGALPRRTLVLGGEACPRALVEEIRALDPALAVLNHYGPTETTVGALVHDVGPGADEIPLGRPLPHVAVRVLDPHGQPAPVGVAGELYLGGAAVARGYLNDPELTAARFADGFYRTGDLVRGRDDGTLAFLGRADDQVKLRGHRVELGEVAAALRAEPGVRDAVALVREERLVAYVVLDDETARGRAAAAPAAGMAPPLGAAAADVSPLRNALAARLPGHLVPAAIVALEALPLTANGKVDRAALPDPAPAETVASAPTTPTELRLAALWSELLGTGAVGREDNFFALGGHSLLATRVAARLRSDFGIELPLRALFDHPTLSALAGYVDILGWAARSAPAATSGYEEGAL